MRATPTICLGALCAVALGAAAAAADDGPTLAITLEPPETLTVGDRAGVVAVVRLEPAGSEPLLVTPSSEGTAVEVVRGRLLRSDAEDPESQPLRFRVPIVARRAGTSVLRVQVRGWACAERCREVVSEASVVLRVRAAG